jgi:hypothetical protein
MPSPGVLGVYSILYTHPEKIFSSLKFEKIKMRTNFFVRTLLPRPLPQFFENL